MSRKNLYFDLFLEMKKTNALVLNLMDKSRGADNAANIPETIAQLNKTLKRMDQFVSDWQGDVEEIVINIRRTSANLSELTENIKKYPMQVLFSSPPPRSEVVE